MTSYFRKNTEGGLIVFQTIKGRTTNWLGWARSNIDGNVWLRFKGLNCGRLSPEKTRKAGVYHTSTLSMTRHLLLDLPSYVTLLADGREELICRMPTARSGGWY